MDGIGSKHRSPMVETVGFTELVVAVDENDQKKLSHLLDQVRNSGQDVLPLLRQNLVGQLPLLHYVCKTHRHNLDMVKYLLDQGCDINAASQEGRPLLIACRSGNTELVKTLLDNGAQIVTQDEIDVEKSPFYVASLMGHYEVIKALMLHQPSMSDIIDPFELVKDESFRSCLLWAGCMGGDLNIVKMWFSPGMDINHPKEFVTSFDDCENNTPLYAACSGDHYDVAEFLVEVGANLTKKICETFPDITWHVLCKGDQCIEEEEDDISSDRNYDLPVPLHKAVFGRIGLGGFHRDWLKPYTMSLVEIDLRENQIEDLPTSIPWSFPLLKMLNVSSNNLKAILPPEKEVFCNRLEEILLINNRLEDLCYPIFQLPKLKSLNLSNNKLQYLVKTHQQQHDWNLMRQHSDTAKAKREWVLPSLTYLNVSHNELAMLPPDIKNCTALVKLDASNNKLTAFPPAWNCKMTSLDLSYNELERFPVSAEQFWCGTLRCLKLDHNKLEEINESIVKLCTLTDLCASNNNIDRLPSAEVWDCKQLYLIDLSSNQLKVTTQPAESPTASGPVKFFRRTKTPSFSEDMSSTIIFPQFLAHCLHDLNLSNNCLEVVPSSICQLTSLEILDLSNNPIKLLPRELGRLKTCHNLILNDLHIDNIPKDLLQVKEVHKRSKDIISLLRNELRQSQKYYTMKLVVLGKKEKGKTTLIDILGGKSEDSHLNVGIRTSSIVIPHPGKRRTGFLSLQRDDSKPNFVFNTWDMAGDEAYIPTQQCFLTQNSIYFLVWDIWSLKDDIDKLGTCLYSLEARTPKSKVILVATNLDKNTTPTRNQEIQEIKTLVMERYGSDCDGFKPRCCNLELCYFAPVSCITKEGIPELKQALYEIAQKIPDPRDRQNKLMGRCIPKSYLELEKLLRSELQTLLENKKPPFLTEQSYKDLFDKIPNSDIEDLEIVQVTKFLIESGSLLHFNDQLKGLNNMYFLDPTWLCEVLSKVLRIQSESPLVRGGKILLNDVMDLYKSDSHYPVEYVEQYIQILERFEIALSVDNRTKLFVPSQLSKNPGMELHSYHDQGKNVRRLYQMPFIPTGLWNRLLSRIMVQVEMLTSPEWTFKINQSFASSTIRRHSSDKSIGLHLTKKDMIYWRDGMYLHHDKGYFMLESVRVPQPRERLTQSGILITVQSKDEDYSVLGMIVDQLDDLLLEHYPGLIDFDDFGQPRIQRFAMCPVCYQGTMAPLDHFTVEHCSRIMLVHESITCKKGVKVPLVELVPELFMTELPEKFQIKYSELEIENSKGSFLGVGITGSVYKGHYGNLDVALKFYHGVPSEQETSAFNSMDSGRSTLSMNTSEKVMEDDDFEDSPAVHRKGLNKQKSSEYANIGLLMASFDLDEANSYKAWKAFTEMRQEVSLTSKLQHPCIVSFIGITVRPKLLMALELAPFGSLRTVLDTHLNEREPFNKYRDKDKIFDSLFSKDLTFKMVYQIAKGLEYLHKCCIVYRDLKSDNILVTSLDISSPINVKLSDYGISKIQSSGGNLGLVGTPGYQAPEIIDGLAYDEKVDMFSFSMVIHEIISGERPYVEYKNLAQITRAIKYESKRPNLQEYNIDSKFPFLEDLMVACWHESASERPSATVVTSISYMRSIQFLCQHKRFKTPDRFRHGEIDCVADISEVPGKKNLLWLWEGCNEDRCYHILNLSTCTYHTYREYLSGPTVTCMAKVGKEVWVGTEGKEIEVYRQPYFGHPKRTNKYEKLGAIPTAIHVLYNDDEQKTCKNVLVALHNGRLQVYLPTTKESVTRPLKARSVVSETIHSGWYLGKTMQLTNFTMSCVTHVPCQKEMWFGCEKEIVVITTDHLLVEGRIKLGNRFPKHNRNNIQSLVYWDERVWCLLQDTAVLLEFDVHLRRPTHIFNCEDPHPMKMNVANYISNLSEQESGEIEDCVFDHNLDIRDDVKRSRPNTLDSIELEQWAESILPEGGTDESESDDDFEMVQTKGQGQIITGQSKLTEEPSPGSSQNLSNLATPPVPPPRRRSAENRDSYITNIPPPVPLRTKLPSHSELSVPKVPVRKAQSISAINEDTSKEMLMTKSSTLPNISSRVHQMNKINIDSAIVVKDTLWVGRSNGDILVININQNNKNICEHGEVISVLYRRNNDDHKTDVSVETLVLVGDLVVSFVKENLIRTDLIAWESYGSSEINNVQEYWASVRKEESKITKAKKQKVVTITEAESY